MINFFCGFSQNIPDDLWSFFFVLFHCSNWWNHKHKDSFKLLPVETPMEESFAWPHNPGGPDSDRSSFRSSAGEIHSDFREGEEPHGVSGAAAHHRGSGLRSGVLHSVCGSADRTGRSGHREEYHCFINTEEEEKEMQWKRWRKNV